MTKLNRVALACSRRLCRWALVWAAAWSGLPVAPGEAAERPNIVVLLADDLGYGETSGQGNAEIPTPHIDGIAARGVRFTAGYVTAPFCSASRAGLLTGRWQTRFGYEFNPIGAQNTDPRVGLPASEATLAQVLHDAGYATGLVGKWHLGGTAPYHPQRRGFDEFFGFLHEGRFYVPPPYPGMTTWLRRRTLPDGGQGRWTSADGSIVLSTHLGSDEPPYDADNPLLRGGQPVEERQHLTDAFTREAVDFLRRHRDRPFFLLVAYNAVHSPMQAESERLRRFAHIPDIHRRLFAAMLSHLDESVGTILATLRETDLEQRTLLVFLSDNGGPTRELTSSNSPLRGGKGDLFEGGVRVPFLCQWPGTIPPGTVATTPVSSVDLFATAVAVAGAPTPQPLDGLDLRTVLGMSREGSTPASSSPPARTFFWRVGDRAALRQGDWKIVRHPARGQPLRWQLFDLSSDVGETRDLASVEPERLAQLAAEWEQLNAEMQPPVWSPWN
jgi:arylsulfatase B